MKWCFLHWFLVMNVILDCTESILLVLMLKAIEESNGVQPLIVSILFKWIVMEVGQGHMKLLVNALMSFSGSV